jgi:AraC-like DNA-binding protein
MSNQPVRSESRIRHKSEWRDAVCNTFVRLECDPEQDAPFHGQLQGGVLGELHVTRVQSSPQIVRRTRELAAQAEDAFILLSIQTRGRTLVEQGQTQALLTPGCIAFYDTEKPYRLTLPNDFDQIVLHLPKETLRQSAPDGLNHMAELINASNPFAQAIAALAPQLLRLATTGHSALAERTAAAAIELISLALASLGLPNEKTPLEPAYTFKQPTAVSDALIWRTRDLISKQIDDTELSPTRLASQVNVSLRRLQEVFKAQGTTPSDCIWEMRLEFARGLLASSLHQNDSVSAVAYRAGFGDVAHFSRRFKQRFGLTPREFRGQV